MAGQIVIVSGTSGAGKSTACELFARRSDQFWLLSGIDQFLASSFPAKFGHHGPRSGEGIHAHPRDEAAPDGALRWSFGEMGMRAFAAFHESIAAASRQGCNIILDHLMMTDPPLLQDAIWRLRDLPVLFVTLKPPFEVLQARVATRPMGKRLALDEEAARRIVDRLDRLRPWFYDAVYANTLCDLEIDTVAHSPESVCDQIAERLAQGPGTAFARLRAIYPRP